MATFWMFSCKTSDCESCRAVFKKFIIQLYEPKVVITNKLSSYVKPIKTLDPNADHQIHKDFNNAVEVSHWPTRKQKKILQVKYHQQALRYLSTHYQINLIFRSRCY